jgi:opacity protein-like surface antigen
MKSASLFHRVSALGVAVLLIAVAAPDDAHAQTFPGFGGMELRLGAANLDDVDGGLSYALDLDIGYLFTPPLRSYLRFEGFRGEFDTDVIAGGGDLNGSGIETGLRYDLLATSRISPYGVVGVNFSNIKARGVIDQSAQDLPDGMHTSFGYGIGAAVHFGSISR